MDGGPQYREALALAKQMVPALARVQRAKSRSRARASEGDKENVEASSFLGLSPLDGDSPEVATLVVATMHSTMTCCTNLLTADPSRMFKACSFHLCGARSRRSEKPDRVVVAFIRNWTR